MGVNRVCRITCQSTSRVTFCIPVVYFEGPKTLFHEHRGCGCSVPYTGVSTTSITAPTTRGNLDQDSIGSTTGDWLTSTDFN